MLTAVGNSVLEFRGRLEAGDVNVEVTGVYVVSVIGKHEIIREDYCDGARREAKTDHGGHERWWSESLRPVALKKNNG